MPAVAGRVASVTPGDAFDLPAILSLVRPVATSLTSSFHGEDHWRDVASIGLALREQTRECDPVVVVLFGVLHDAKRIGDDSDPPHGVRGADLAGALDLGRFGLSAQQLALLDKACRGHTGGGLSGDPTIGTCWDADRLTLWRVGTVPSARYMSTPAGREAAAAGQRCARVNDWSEISRQLLVVRPRASSPPPRRT